MLTIVKVPYLAEDLVQDVFIKIWNIRARLDIKQHFRPYLFRVCHNSAVDLNKQIATDRRLTDQLVFHYQALTDPDQYSQADLLKYDALVEAALESLTPQRRRIYEMCRKEKKSYEEVAQILDISPFTVKAHLAQTLSLLRTYISKHAKFPVIIFLLQKLF